MPDAPATLTPRTALGGTVPRHCRHGPNELIERPDLALASLALSDGTPPPRPFGLDLPQPAGLTVAGNAMAIWMARSRWMICVWGRAGADTAGDLSASLPDAIVVDQTDDWAAIEIVSHRGDCALRALAEKSFDLDFDALGPGAAVRTVTNHMNVLILRLSEDRLLILGIRSMAGSLWDDLETTWRRIGRSMVPGRRRYESGGRDDGDSLGN